MHSILIFSAPNPQNNDCLHVSNCFQGLLKLFPVRLRDEERPLVAFVGYGNLAHPLRFGRFWGGVAEFGKVVWFCIFGRGGLGGEVF
jgi:hypothetical protein